MKMWKKDVRTMITDTHAHLNDTRFDGDVIDVISRAKAHDVTRIIVIGMDNPTSRKAIRIASGHEGIFATAGIHPGYVDTDTDIKGIEEILGDGTVVAVGETGLDFHWTRENAALQMELFKAQIRLSVTYGLPLVIHTRASFDEAYRMLLPYKGKARGVFHCFSSTLEDAMRAVDLGFHIGLDGPVTYKNGDVQRAIAQEIPLDRLLVETDSPYLAPQSHRGKRNEPAYLTDIVGEIARARGMTAGELALATSKNADLLFRLGGKDS
jgi:TatD DNase family protein